MTAPWWQSGVIYQVYPRSFQDSDGDGVGDLQGIMRRLDYIHSLKVDAVWLSPIYPSPMADFGYDVSNYVDVHPLFGTLQDFDEMRAAIKRLGLKLILDYVPNHTSDAHPWFQESRSDRASAKRDWYLWHDPRAEGGPPNNWLSHFGGSAWEWDARTEQYYCHSFLKEQPDLNWRNPDVVAAMHEALRFWMKRGVDGFRVDVLWLLIKDDLWRDNPPNPDFKPGMPLFQSQLALYTADRPEVQSIVAGLRRVVDEFEERVLIGEIYLPLDRLMAYYGASLAGVQMPFNFLLLQSPWSARAIAALIDRYEGALPTGGWPNWVLGNHDKPRIASRIGKAQARVAAMLLLTLRGTPTLYYGDELGMLDGVIPADRVQDPLEKNVPGAGLGRDPCRTPLPWEPTPGAGFTTGEPWLPIAEDYRAVNVASEAADPGSSLALYRRLLELRAAHPALSMGKYRPVATSGDVLAYLREHPEERFLVVLNLSAKPAEVDVAPSETGLIDTGLIDTGLIDSGLIDTRGRIMLSTYLDKQGEACGTKLRLRENEGLIISLATGMTS